MKKFRYLAILALLVLPLLGCGKRQSASQTTTLWVVTERSNSDGMNYQMERIAERLEEKYGNLTIELELLPTDETEREDRLKKLRSQIMSGGGPDIYLLPTGSELTMDVPQKNTVLTVEPLFPDVQQAMLSGLFQDVDAYYASDTELNTAGLKTEIMAAGCVGDRRYVLPLRYDMDMLLVDGENWAASGMDALLMEGTVEALAEAVLTQDTTGLGAYALQLPTDLSILPQTFDYEKGELLLTPQDIADYMRLYQKWYSIHTPLAQTLNAEIAEMIYQTEPHFYDYFGYPEAVIRNANSISTYITCGAHWGLDGIPLYSENMEYLLDSAEMGKKLGRDMTVHALRDAKGNSCATVTYYGAVGAGCADPELAYEFLRLFLTEEFQWDLYRPRVKKTIEPLDHEDPEPQRGIQVEQSWPVRAAGCEEVLWDNRSYQLFHSASGTRNRILAVRTDTMDPGDIPFLAEPIDEVYFPIVQEEEETLAYALSLLNGEDGTPTDVDIDALAEEVYLNLWWHLAEG